MNLLERIIQYANQEVSEGKQTIEDHACISHEEWKVIEGRVEFAEGLLANIKEWQDESGYPDGWWERVAKQRLDVITELEDLG